MLFSERHGYKKHRMLKKDEMPESLRNELWNMVYDRFFVYLNDDTPDWALGNMSEYRILRNIWISFFKGDKLVLQRGRLSDVVDEINTRYHELPWHEVYDFVEFVLCDCMQGRNRKELAARVSEILKEEKAPYQVTDCRISPPLGDEEMTEEIERALKISDKFAPVRQHISKALAMWADRKNPDYANSIKESISAVESLVQIVHGKKGTLGDLIKTLNVHPALRQGFSNLYGWTSEEEGVRHAKSKEPLSCEEAEARYMLITCSAFVNYVISKTAAQ